MKTFIVDGVYEVQGYRDEMGGGAWLVGYFLNHNDAEAAAVGQGAWGASGSIIGPKRLEVKVFESYEEYQKGERDKLRQIALSKLTLEERHLLGLE